MIAGSQIMFAHDLTAANDASNPISATINTEQTFDDDLARSGDAGVDDAEGGSTVMFQVSAGPNVWKTRGSWSSPTSTTCARQDRRSTARPPPERAAARTQLADI
jgi:hypothetical protein